MEAEDPALSKVCMMILHLRHLLNTVISEQEGATVIFQNNTGALKRRRNDKVIFGLRYVEIKFDHVKSVVKGKVVTPNYIVTDPQRADVQPQGKEP